jgi:formylglycine-generating enzyme required for sulfatase activity
VQTDGEGPRRLVTLSDFMIDKYEVGVCMSSSPTNTRPHHTLQTLLPRRGGALCHDCHQVSNEEYREFVQSTGYRTESEAFGWSFVFDSAVPPQLKVQWPRPMQPRDCV